MVTHPFIRSFTVKVCAGILTVLALFIHFGFLYGYEDIPMVTAIGDSIISTGLWVFAAWFTGYMSEYLKVWSAQLTIGTGIQIVCILGCYIVVYMTQGEGRELFIHTIPFRFLFGLLAWYNLFQWYKIQSIKEETTPVEIVEEPLLQEETKSPKEPEEIIDRVSVKDGSKIHIIYPEQILYIQACGDYVTIFTENGQYLKEQTMKYLEAHLPSSFVRIHRSCIANIDYILRIELFGKENYQVKLKNGSHLKASISGYKQLRQRLNL